MAAEECTPTSENWLVAMGRLDPKVARTCLQLDNGQIVSIETALLVQPSVQEDLAEPSLEDATVTIPVVAEELVVSKRTVPVETVRLVRTQEQTVQRLELPLVQERWEITRLAKEVEVNERYGVRQDGETMIYPLFEERLVVRKTLFLVEEIHATKVVETTVKMIEETLLRDVVDVERAVRSTEL